MTERRPGICDSGKAAGYSVRKARAATERSTPTTCQHCGAYAARLVYTHRPSDQAGQD
jgi:hypothetical protein